MASKITTLIEAIDLLPGAWCLMDPKSRYLHYNFAYLKMIGAEHLSRYDLIGKTVADMPCNAASCAELFWEEDDEVRRTKKTVTVLNTIKMKNDQWWVIQINKCPILNERNEIEAILFNFIDHSNNNFLDLALQINKNLKHEHTAKAQIKIKRKSQIVSLGIKESEVLFYLARGISYKEIAAMQNVAYSTIIDHVERIKNKFHAATLEELIKNALSNGYPHGLPQALFDKQFSIIFTD
jgi:DNA-binding CsgD family transcriptional regulator